ncbi:APC family permease [Streptomyces ipomoeae]|uniref:APC family permease n=1 Tax=Streptomyces ipomoeae TaxID=103232 RepID=UPI00114761D6|nr:APC family permease [Streptomyces ipomoeae]MDX2938358.1 APC family permease [Streptomyces ipomoeae]TQE22062.1 APC family permease [Streptomyces ipomoeae]
MIDSMVPQAVAPERRLRQGALGTSGITLMVLSAAAPLTVMAGIAPLSILLGGIGAPMGYLVAAVVMALFAVGFVAMTKYVERPGAFYAYVERGLGRRAGSGAGLLALLAYNGIQISGYAILGSSADLVLRTFFGIHVHWAVPAVLGVLLVWALGYRGVEVGAWVLGVLLGAEAIVLTLVAGSVVVQGGANGLSLESFHPSHTFTAGMAAALTVCFGSFLGFESTAVYRSEARDPDRSVPRATVVALAFLGVFYTFVVWSVVQAFGPERAVSVAAENTQDMYYVAAERYTGAWIADVMKVLILTSVIASALAFHNTVNRYTHSLAVQGMLPAALSRVHPVHRSPSTAGAWQSLLAIAVITGFAATGSDPYRTMLIWLNTPGIIGIVLLQAITALAVVVFFWRNPGLPRRSPILSVALVSLVLMTSVTAVLIRYTDILTGAGWATNAVLVGLVPVVLLIGIARPAPRSEA